MVNAVSRARLRRPVGRRGAGEHAAGGDVSPASDSATRACTCRTACRIRSRAMVRDFIPAGYVTDPRSPHGMSVILNAPAVFRFTAQADPHRHLEAARLMGADVAGRECGGRGRDPGRRDHRPHAADRHAQRAESRGVRPEDIDALVAGTIVQHRVTKLSPRPASEAELKQLFLNSMTIW